MASDSPALDLFGDSSLPEGFRYQPDFLNAGDERFLLDHIKGLPFWEFEFQGFTGKRRIVSYGWRYDFNGGGLTKAEDMPEFLSGVRARAEGFAGLAPGELQQALITEYSEGAAIGWHKDRSVFGEVVGISLLSSCTFRLGLKAGSAGNGAILPQSRAPLTCCAVRRVPRGSTVFRVWKACDTRSRSAIFLKGLPEHGPDDNTADASPAHARHAHRLSLR